MMKSFFRYRKLLKALENMAAELDKHTAPPKRYKRLARYIVQDIQEQRLADFLIDYYIHHISESDFEKKYHDLGFFNRCLKFQNKMLLLIKGDIY